MAAESSASPSGGGPRGAAPASGYLSLLEIARGGMGKVELAVRAHEHFSRLFAIKRLHPQFSQSPEARAAFLQEGRVAALLRHPSAVSVLDVGEDEFGPYLVMEYVEGASVAALITQARQRDELLPVQICLRACLQAAQGLQAAHELVDHQGQPHGFLHRDVSPQNILVGFDGLARVTDFGVAQTIFTDQQTFSGTLKGKLRYMAPERLRFEQSDARSDLFSLGVVLYEMLSSEHLFTAEGETEIAQQVLHASTPDIGLVREGVPLPVVQLLFELLAKDPAFRPASAAAVAERLDAALTELEFEQGKVATDAYMKEHFGPERKVRRAEVSAALEQAQAAPERPQGTQAPMVRGLGRRRVAGLSLVAAAIALIAWAWVMLRSESGATVGPPSASSAADPEPAAAKRGERRAAPTDLAAATTAVTEPSTSAPAVPIPSAGTRAGRAGRPVRPTSKPRRAALPPPRTGPRPATPAKPPANCASPFYYDENGVKRVRKECF